MKKVISIRVHDYQFKIKNSRIQCRNMDCSYDEYMHDSTILLVFNRIQHGKLVTIRNGKV